MTYRPHRYQSLKANWKHFTFMMDYDTHRELKANSSRTETPISELIRRYIEWGLENERT